MNCTGRGRGLRAASQPSDRGGSERSIAAELSLFLHHNFVPAIVPSPEEYQQKEAARHFLERLTERVCPGAKLLPFGSMANGFALGGCDMDLCCLLDRTGPQPGPSAPEFVQLVGGQIAAETDFKVKMLPRARIPIIKLELPGGLACDIGFENRLALDNTRLLLTYAMIDPRLRVIVLLTKVWAKRRSLNNPYRGTLSSYGFVLLVIHFLAHVVHPPVLPNLQQLARDAAKDGEFVPDVAFFDELELLPTVWQTANDDCTGQLVMDFFRHFATEFDYAGQVISIRSREGTISKLDKRWTEQVEFDPESPVRDLHFLCIEDPFQLDYNVARTVTQDGLNSLRQEFLRAYELLSSRQSSDSVVHVVNELVGLGDGDDGPAEPIARARFFGPSAVAPAPIFPERDRQAVALANSITFGNFPSRGRSLPELDDRPSARQRGRSVPHWRLDEDGTRSILFGEIAVRIASDVEESVD